MQPAHYITLQLGVHKHISSYSNEHLFYLSALEQVSHFPKPEENIQTQYNLSVIRSANATGLPVRAMPPDQIQEACFQLWLFCPLVAGAQRGYQ